ncbi:MAG: hypothetical protein NTY09_02180 [bacterium]|nr:hypothetical protein [bacterium]
MPGYMKSIQLIFPIIILLTLIGCNPDKNAADNGQGTHSATGDTGATAESDADPYQAAELLAERLILYKLAFQEGDIAPFTALQENIVDKGFPEIPVQLNKLWWQIDWEGAHIAPLPALQISSLETAVFPYMAARVDESDENAGWVLMTIGYDSSMIRLLIADAHTEWPPEVRESFLMSHERGCLHVWCGLINGEWKLIAHLPCSEDETSPTPPQVQFDQSSSQPSSDEATSTGTSNENSVDENSGQGE